HAILGHRHRLSGIAVAVVTGRLLLLILEVYIQLSGQHPLRQALLQLADQTVVAQQPGAVLAPLQQLVDQLIINRRFGASCHVPLLGSVSWLNTQNLLHPLSARSPCGIARRGYATRPANKAIPLSPLRERGKKGPCSRGWGGSQGRGVFPLTPAPLPRRGEELKSSIGREE